jgi:hypothetical protein
VIVTDVGVEIECNVALGIGRCRSHSGCHSPADKPEVIARVPDTAGPEGYRKHTRWAPYDKSADHISRIVSGRARTVTIGAERRGSTCSQADVVDGPRIGRGAGVRRRLAGGNLSVGNMVGMEKRNCQEQQQEKRSRSSRRLRWR